MAGEGIEDIRKKIDALDEKLVKILNQRAGLGVKIAKVKSKSGDVVYHPAREMEILEKVEDLNKGPLSGEAVKSVFKEIFSATRSVEQNLRIACLGPAGSFSHLAARGLIGPMAQYILEQGLDRVFKAVESGAAELGVVPIENSIEGAIGQTMDLFVNSPVKIHAESFYKVHLNLLSKVEKLEKVKVVYSQYMPLGQCRGWLGRNLPGARIIETSSTAEAAIKAAKEKGAAAIGAKEMADIYGLPIRARNLEDRSGNQTRFLVISMKGSPPAGANKTSIVFSTKDEPGALFKVLNPLDKKNINLSGIQSRPSPLREWEYMFFVDFMGSLESREVKWALEKMKPLTVFLKPLGSYPAAKRV